MNAFTWVHGDHGACIVEQHEQRIEVITNLDSRNLRMAVLGARILKIYFLSFLFSLTFLILNLLDVDGFFWQ